MDVTIKAKLVEGYTFFTLRYEIKYKIGSSLKYKECDPLTLVSMWDDINSREQFNKKAVERLSELNEEKVEQMIIDKLKEFLQTKKVNNSKQNEYESLINKYGKLKFKVKI